MWNFFKSLGNKKYQAKIIDFSNQIKILCDSQTNNIWQLSYFVSGSYGNYLFGLPVKIKKFDQLITNLGGIKFIVPWVSPEINIADHKFIFVRYGSTVIWSEDSVKDFPIKKSEEVSHTDIILKVLRVENTTVLKVKTKNESMLMSANFGVLDSQLIHTIDYQDHNLKQYTFMPSWGRGPFKEIIEEINNQPQIINKVDSLPSLSPFVSTSQVNTSSTHSVDGIIQQLEVSNFLYHYDSQSLSICFFDDVEFERNDIEITAPEVRAQLNSFFSQLNFEKQSGDSYVNQSNPNNLSFSFAPTPHTQMSSLTSFNNVMPVDSIKIITPTQQAAIILEDRVDTQQRLFSLASELPLNIRKLKPLIIKRFQGQEQKEVQKKASYLQKNCIDYFKKTKPKGAKGKKNKLIK